MTTSKDKLYFPPRVVDALNEQLQRQPQESQVTQKIAGAYYDGRLTFGQLRSLVGEDEASNFRVLKEQLDEGFNEEMAE